MVRLMQRISRPCYDKQHRCPGWAGGGMKYAKVDRCDDGRIMIDYDDKLWKYKFWPCDTCNVLVLPRITRYLDPANYIWRIKFWCKFR